MPTINWLIGGDGAIQAAMDIPFSPLPPLSDERLPRRAIQARLRAIAALRRTQQRDGGRRH